MRISGVNQQYYLGQTQRQTSTETQSTTTSSTGFENSVSSSATFSDQDTSSDVDSIKSNMLNDPKVQMMKQKINGLDENERAKMENIKTTMDSVSDAKLEDMSLEEKQALLASVDSAFSGEQASTTEIEALEEEDLTRILTDIQNKTQEMSRDSGGTKGLGNVRGSGGPGRSGGARGAGAVSFEEDEEDEEVSTLQQLLDALYSEDEEDEEEDEANIISDSNLSATFLQNYAASQYSNSANLYASSLSNMSV